MKRKDGKPKLKAKRLLPQFKYGFRNNPHVSYCSEIDCTEKQFSVMSFFSGCGGLDLGFTGGFSVFGEKYDKLPFNIIGAYDNHQDAVDCYQLNLGDHVYNVDLTQKHVFQEADILIGGFPCQDFSSAGPKTGTKGKRGGLYKVMVDYMLKYKPKVVIGENVSYLSKLRDGRCLEIIVKDFESAGYHFDVWELHAQKYGVPQNRVRLIFVGVRNDIDGFPVKPIPTTPDIPFTISDAISDLEVVTDESVTNQSQFFIATKATSGGGQGDNVNSPDKVAYCIRANARGRIQFHYKLDRRLTVRECARIQTFPDEFVFQCTTQRNLTLIGNAVPPILAHAIATSIAKFLKAIEASLVYNT
ncbi:MAG TPA: DNA (cytosine-5-)-methyltransferase [Lentisphaeria bacterium]|nr:MAG: Modification methylase BspRI [Lentisphaerae bacterium ADurb.Bin082]HQC51674.1 DNA (cytosine-5-)-methyltransferase [Lentisphaeria bacterium]HQL87367.1 DNA (cytosine-5-)-methyltransferase [Lentisphaeria bacterium]